MIIVFGADGQLGQSLKKINNKKEKIIYLNKKTCDITKYHELKKIFDQYRPKFIVNAAAYTNVPLAEKYKKKSYNINAKALINLSKLSNKFNSKLIHISTDYVFDGKKKSKYNENDKTKPISWYGHTKLEGEKNIIKYSKKYIIIRTSGLFSNNNNSFINKIVNKIQKNENFEVVSDQFSYPCFSDNLARLIWKIAKNNKIIKYNEIYNYNGHQRKVSWYNFANKIMKYSYIYCKSNSIIMPSKINKYNKIVKRPINSCLCNKKINKYIKLQYDFDNDIKSTIKNIFNSR